jgi:hypothetical protein
MIFTYYKFSLIPFREQYFFKYVKLIAIYNSKMYIW